MLKMAAKAYIHQNRIMNELIRSEKVANMCFTTLMIKRRRYS